MLDEILGIFKALFMFGAAYWCYGYYSGKVGFSGEAENRRSKRVKQYGGIFLLAIILSLAGGVILFAYHFYNLLISF